MTRARELAELGAVYDSGALSNRNVIINGNFTISQRGDYTSSTSVSDGNYYLDRWEYVEDGSPTSSLIHNTDGTVKITTGASVTGSSRLRQKFEYSKFPRQYDNQTFTVSAKIKSNSTNARINVYAGGYLSLTGTTAHSGGGSFETLTATFTTPSTISTEFSVHIGIDGASSANVSITSGEYFEVKEIQMERGTEATPFEHRSFGQELALCQRYYERQNGQSGTTIYGVGYNESTTISKGMIPFKVTKRAVPTVSVQNSGHFCNVSTGTTYVASSVSFDGQSPINTRYTCTSSSASLVDGGAANLQRFTGDAIIEIDSEL